MKNRHVTSTIPKHYFVVISVYLVLLYPLFMIHEKKKSNNNNKHLTQFNVQFLYTSKMYNTK